MEKVYHSTSIENIKEFVPKESTHGHKWVYKSKGNLIIKMYPEKIDGIPEDDEDLVHRGIVWTRKHGNVILNQIKKFHPHLLDRVVKGIEEGAYLKI